MLLARMAPIDPGKLGLLWRLNPSSTELVIWLNSIAGSHSTSPKADIKSYPDEQYHNYYSLGLSLTFTPLSKDSTEFALDRIDIYNPPSSPPPPTARRQKGRDFNAPELPITFHFPSNTLEAPPSKPGEPSTQIDRPPRLSVDRNTTGREFVSCFGEPSKKSEGKIIGDLGVGLWMEWDGVEITSGVINGEAAEKTMRIGIMVELCDPGANQKVTPEQEKKGLGGVWDRAATWEWSCFKLFDPSASQRP